MQVRTTKDEGLYNKTSAGVHPGALAAGTLQQYNTIVHNLTNEWWVDKDDAQTVRDGITFLPNSVRQ